MPNIFVGVDVSKYKFDASIKDDKNEVLMKPRVYTQNLDGLHRFMHDIDKVKKDENTKVLIGMESTARYHLNLMGFLLKNGYNVREFNPIEVYGFRKSRIRQTKTDAIDTGLIASALILDAMENTQRYIKDQDYIRMREIGLLHIRLKEKIAKLKVEMREALTVLCPGYDALFTNVLGKSSKEILRSTVKHTKLFEIGQDEIETILKKNYISPRSISEKARKVKRSFNDTTVPDIYRESLIVQVRYVLDQHDLLQRQLDMVDARIDRAIRDIDPVSISIPCVGPITCAVVLGTCGDVRKFRNNNSITAFAGLDPRVIQSGKSINRTGRISKSGNKYLRTALLNAAFIGCKHNPVIRHKYAQLRKRNKSHMVALTACARKLLLMIYSVEKNQKRFYVPDYISNE